MLFHEPTIGAGLAGIFIIVFLFWTLRRWLKGMKSADCIIDEMIRLEKSKRAKRNPNWR